MRSVTLCVFRFTGPPTEREGIMEFRIEGISLAGKPVQGLIEADNSRQARKKAQLLSVQRKFKLVHILKRSTFLYKVQRGTEKPFTGEQKAFTRAEVQDALVKMGYRVISVQ